MLISSLSIIANIFVLIFHHRNVKIQAEMPYWVRIYICNYLAQFLRMKNPWNIDKKQKSTKNVKLKNSKANFDFSNSMSLLVNVLNLNDDFGVPKIINFRTNYKCDNLNENRKNIIFRSNEILKELTLILKQLILITDKIKSDEKNEKKSLDWKFAAMVIDRLCIIFFTFATIISTALILMTSNNFFGDSDSSSDY